MPAHDLLVQHIRAAEAFETGDNGGFPAIPEEREEISSSGSTVQGEEKGSPEPRYAATRTVTGKSTTSNRTNTDVNTLVRMLSRRATGQDGTDEDGEGYEHDLEDIMGGIFGNGDDDISKRKNVGVIWKHLTVFNIPELY